MSAKYKPMDVVYLDHLRRPRGIVVEVYSHDASPRYTVISQSGGYHSGSPESALMTQDEWLEFLARFSDDLTGREMRELREAALAPFVEPKEWAGFRTRYAETGDPWLRENAHAKKAEVPA